MIYFQHNPKCGGTTIFRLLAEHFKYANFGIGERPEKTQLEIEFANIYGQNGTEGKIIKSNANAAHEIELVRAHQKFREITKQNCKSEDIIITNLRNPVDVWYSSAFHSYRNESLNILKQQVDKRLNTGTKIYSIFINFNPDLYHFVAIQEHMDWSCKKLSELLGVDIKNNLKANVNHNRFIDEAKLYRRDEVCKKLEKETECYNNFVKTYLETYTP